MPNDAKNWSANQRKFMVWLAVPSKMREPATQGEFAKVIGVVDSTLSRWKRETGFGADVGRLSRELLKDDLPDIFGALKREAKAGSFQHIKLALEVAGEHTDEVNLNVSDRRIAIASRLAAIAQEGEGQARNGAGALGPAPHAN